MGLPQKNFETSFTLIEIAISLFILTLVLGALLIPLSTQIEERQTRDTEKIMSEMVEALIGFAITQTTPRLPCPDRTSAGAGGINDTANDGLEDYNTTTGVCMVADGNIPWATLNVSATDLWGNRYRYLVTTAFANRSPATTMTLSSAGNLKVCTRAPIDAVCTVVNPVTLSNESNSYLAENVPAIIISHGRNGYGAINGSSNTQISTAGASAHEIENAGGTQQFSLVSKTRSEVSSEQFDDIVVWLSPHVLFNRLVAANKLP